MNDVSRGAIRKPAVADQFYPASAPRLKRMVDDFLSHANHAANARIKALIVPHAGYIYSAAIAATAYKTISNQSETIKKVVLVGPSHRVGLKGIAISSAQTYQMPFGDVLLDQALTEKVKAFSQVHERDDAHLQEHSLEVQLPFLQTLLQEFTLLPLVVGDCDAQQVSEVLQAVWGGDDTLLVISSDLSHYLPYDTAQEMDHQTANAIVHLSPEQIQYEHACGRNPVNGLLLCARKFELTPQLVDLRNSGDTAGLRDRVVGYGAFIFSQPSAKSDA